jgi:RHS repeat-associated protein
MYGFGGYEKDNSTAENSYDYGARIYNGKIARWLSVDPMQNIYPMSTPYSFVSNSPNGHEFQALFHWHCEDLGIRHVYIKKTSPHLNGKVERSYLTDQTEF